jgi:hypothetical protein
MTTNAKQQWFYFYCERCNRNSNFDGFLLDGDYSDCYPCPDCQSDYDTEKPMTFRPATKEEERRLGKKKYDPMIRCKQYVRWEHVSTDLDGDFIAVTERLVVTGG